MKKGFTLIELLIVIAIIAILASLLLPALSQAKSRGQSIKCLSNLKQQQLSLIQYTQDNQKYPPFAVPSDIYHPLGQKWYSLLKPYTASSWSNSVMSCPSYKDFVFDGWSEGNIIYISMGSYGYSVGTANSHGVYILGLAGEFGAGLSSYVDTFTREDTVKNPSDMITLGDSFSVESNGNLTLGLEFLTRKLHYPENWSPIEVSLKDAKKRHAGKSNISFADGHSEQIKLETLYLSKKEKDLRRWFSDNLPHENLFP